MSTLPGYFERLQEAFELEELFDQFDVHSEHAASAAEWKLRGTAAREAHEALITYVVANCKALEAEFAELATELFK